MVRAAFCFGSARGFYADGSVIPPPLLGGASPSCLRRAGGTPGRGVCARVTLGPGPLLLPVVVALRSLGGECPRVTTCPGGSGLTAPPACRPLTPSSTTCSPLSSPCPPRTGWPASGMTWCSSCTCTSGGECGPVLSCRGGAGRWGLGAWRPVQEHCCLSDCPTSTSLPCSAEREAGHSPALHACTQALAPTSAWVQLSAAASGAEVWPDRPKNVERAQGKPAPVSPMGTDYPSPGSHSPRTCVFALVCQPA